MKFMKTNIKIILQLLRDNKNHRKLMKCLNKREAMFFYHFVMLEDNHVEQKDLKSQEPANLILQHNYY